MCWGAKMMMHACILALFLRLLFLLFKACLVLCFFFLCISLLGPVGFAFVFVVEHTILYIIPDCADAV
ncbi:hypothetical protein BO94DRAFT_49111 [Aspergillus sclerotioniger CBS 115572]|uniref:Uncharacterized protein n=1 Tax=Aspergillus sclerotioniger CBS 115572 TaxID=1450535 RepID=A0A317WQE1_9EURO|nr:hypothetical protein BO94DRAFT_49111 [Aspergillus sclerotioniger CBS 115572]PWY88714.1 hypothetical protein BO94DRAFT_49111 [Aspergillus sclerotioniger CBS 115572]